MGSQNSAPEQPVCLLDPTNSHNCEMSNPVVSFLKKLDDGEVNKTMRQRREFNMRRFRKIGEELVSNAVLHESVNEGKCFQVSRWLNQNVDDDTEAEDEIEWDHDHAPNWLCEDDLENYWLRNCFILLPTITTCMDELAILKHTGDVVNLELAMQRHQMQEEIAKRDHLQTEGQEPDFFYNFDFLAQLFVGQCIKVDGEMYCPRPSIHVDELEPSILKKHRCAVFDDIVIC